MADPAGDVAAAVMAEPDNAIVMDVLGVDARRVDSADAFALDGWELRTHPDLGERLAQVAERLDGCRSVPLYGRPALAAESGRLFALAQGTGWLCLRDPGLVDRDLAARRFVHPTLGSPWTVVEAWLVDVPLPEHLPLLASLAAEAQRLADVPTADLVGGRHA